MPEVTRPVVDKIECLERLEGIKTTVGPEHKALKDMIIHATSNSKPLKAFTSAKHERHGEARRHAIAQREEAVCGRDHGTGLPPVRQRRPDARGI
jgi:hypothetical protein